LDEKNIWLLRGLRALFADVFDLEQSNNNVILSDSLFKSIKQFAEKKTQFLSDVVPIASCKIIQNA
jgi:hypothetical protein